MEPVTVVVNAGHIYFVLGAIAGFGSGWFAGTWYQRRKSEGLTKAEMVDKAEALTLDKIKPYLQVILNEVNKLKGGPPLT